MRHWWQRLTNCKYLCQICPRVQIYSPAFQISCNHCPHFIIETSEWIIVDKLQNQTLKWNPKARESYYLQDVAKSDKQHTWMPISEHDMDKQNCLDSNYYTKATEWTFWQVKQYWWGYVVNDCHISRRDVSTAYTFFTLFNLWEENAGCIHNKIKVTNSLIAIICYFIVHYHPQH